MPFRSHLLAKLIDSRLALFLLLLGVGVMSRLLIDLPNLKPIGAICMFAGIFFRDLRWGLALSLATLLISDSLLGFYNWPLVISVYASAVLYVCIGRVGWLYIQRNGGRFWNRIGLAGCTAMLGSLQFFIVTNAAFWLFSGLYGLTAGDAIQCFVAAIPFFKWTIAGDLLFFAAPVSVALLLQASQLAPQLAKSK